LSLLELPVSKTVHIRATPRKTACRLTTRTRNSRRAVSAERPGKRYAIEAWRQLARLSPQRGQRPADDHGRNRHMQRTGHQKKAQHRQDEADAATSSRGRCKRVFASERF